MSNYEQCSNQLQLWIGAHSDHIWLYRGQMSDFELIATWPNFTLDHIYHVNWGKKITWYDFLEVRQMILSNVWTNSNSNRYDFLEARWVILRNVRTVSNSTWFHFWSTSSCLWVYTNNDQIWFPTGCWAMFKPTSTYINLISILVNFQANYKWRGQ